VVQSYSDVRLGVGRSGDFGVELTRPARMEILLRETQSEAVQQPTAVGGYLFCGAYATGGSVSRPRSRACAKADAA
jgi:hypothetical protein